MPAGDNVNVAAWPRDSGHRGPGITVIFFALAARIRTTDSAGRAARRNLVAARARPLHNPPPMSPPIPSTARAGFTVVELMVTIAILAILLGIAAPNLRDFVMDVRLTGQANDLMGDLMLARSEAVKRDLTVAVCARKQNENKEAEACTTGNQWDNGWMVVIDADTDGKIDAGTTPLTVKDPLSGDNKIRNDVQGPKGDIVFTATGVTTSKAITTFSICDSRGKGRQIIVQPTGRAAVTKVETGCKAQ